MIDLKGKMETKIVPGAYQHLQHHVTFDNNFVTYTNDVTNEQDPDYLPVSWNYIGNEVYESSVLNLTNAKIFLNGNGGNYNINENGDKILVRAPYTSKLILIK